MATGKDSYASLNGIDKAAVVMLTISEENVANLLIKSLGKGTFYKLSKRVLFQVPVCTKILDLSVEEKPVTGGH